MKINQRLYNKFDGIQQLKDFLKDGLSSEFSVLFMFTSMQDAYSTHRADDLISHLSHGIKLMPLNALRCHIHIWQ